MNRPQISIVHPSDPTEPLLGGFDSCLQGFIASAPADWRMEFIGVSHRLPAGRHVVNVHGRELDFRAVVPDGNQAHRLPLSLRFALACRRRRVSPTGRIVHFHRFESFFAVPDTGARRVCFLHNHPPELSRAESDSVWRWMAPMYMAALYRAIRHCDAVWSVDPRTPQWMTTLPGAPPCRLLPMWVDTRIFTTGSPAERAADRLRLREELGLPGSAPVVLFAGRFDRQKNLPLLLDTFRELSKIRPETQLVLAGEGPLKTSLNMLARAQGVDHQTHVLGPRDYAGVARLMRSADAFLCTSWYEAGPRTVFESLACGTPAVTLPVGQAAQLACGSDVLRLVPEATPKALGAALAALLGQETDWDRVLLRRNAVANNTPAAALDQLFINHAGWLSENSGEFRSDDSEAMGAM